MIPEIKASLQKFEKSFYIIFIEKKKSDSSVWTLVTCEGRWGEWYSNTGILTHLGNF